MRRARFARAMNDRGQCVRDVRQGTDGALYIVTDERNGELWKLTPGP
jgi:glucose/arabinose dehydrogenase